MTAITTVTMLFVFVVLIMLFVFVTKCELFSVGDFNVNSLSQYCKELNVTEYPSILRSTLQCMQLFCM